LITAVRASKRANGRIAVGGMTIDDSASYCATARWADVIDNEVQTHVSSLSLQANGGHSKGSAKVYIARTHERLAMASQPNCTSQLSLANLSRPVGSNIPIIHSPMSEDCRLMALFVFDHFPLSIARRRSKLTPSAAATDADNAANLTPPRCPPSDGVSFDLLSPSRARCARRKRAKRNTGHYVVPNHPEIIQRTKARPDRLTNTAGRVRKHS
jgi:hypothetical protein